jgi:glycolate oxidase
MKQNVISKLIAIVGNERCRTAMEDLIAYSYDASSYEFMPEAVVFPKTTEEVSRIMKLCSENNVYVTPRGAATGFGAECLAKQGGIVLSFTMMDRIIEINTANRYAIVEPGVIVSDLQKAVEELKLFYPPDPGSANVATIGGTVMMNSGGMRGIKYGVTRDYLLGMEIVLPSGDVMKTGTVTSREVTGFDLMRLICGSEGTLALATSITLRLLPKPETKRTLLAIYDKLDHAGATVSKILEAGIIPATCELMDTITMQSIEDFYHLGFPVDAAAALLIDVDGDYDTVASQAPLVAGLCKKAGAREVRVSTSDKENDQLWAARRCAFGALARLAPQCAIEDATVPITRLVEAIKKVIEICRKNRVRLAVVGHAGDGNLHPLIPFDGRDKEEQERVEKAMDEFTEYAMSIGGTISGEHGIGINKAKYLPLQLSPTSLRIQREIKKTFDPQGILNPGSFLEACPL